MSGPGRPSCTPSKAKTRARTGDLHRHRSGIPPPLWNARRHLSWFFGFPDDLWVRVTDSDQPGTCLVEAQGSLRIGGDDLMVNQARIARLWKDLAPLEAEGRPQD